MLEAWFSTPHREGLWDTTPLPESFQEGFSLCSLRGIKVQAVESPKNRKSLTYSVSQREGTRTPRALGPMASKGN